ncbi:MAG: hypothetical protein KIT84_09330 [Labilithrix sp.]|nr:hypothetical protein [Labilithrix sp.]MCW5811202.1 hypothetical protein [Labilithrix sp.]
MGDPLFDAILAAPDDDAARLVWADREGGARGELVVLQCSLAARTAPADQRELFARRAGELVRAHGAEWTPLASYARPTFVRGFVEEVTIALAELEGRAETIWRDEPLVRTLVVTDVAQYAVISSDGRYPWAIAAVTLEDVFARIPPGKVTSLALSPFAEATGIWEDLYRRPADFGRVCVRAVAGAPSLARVEEIVIPGVPDARALLAEQRGIRAPR